MTYSHGVDAGDDAEVAELRWAAVEGDGAEQPVVPGIETEMDAEPDQPEAEAPEAPQADTAAWPAADEWDDLRQVLAGDDGPPVADDDDVDVDDEADDEVDDDVLAEDDATDEELAPSALVEAVADLAARVEQLTAELDEERAERERLAGQLDRLATDLDAVLGEALDAERERRVAIEESLRQVQSMLSESAPAAYDGPERRQGPERRVAGERRRTGARRERPLRARDFTPEPVDEEAPDDAEIDAEADGTASAWKSRLHEVAGSVSSWSADDIDRLRVD